MLEVPLEYYISEDEAFSRDDSMEGRQHLTLCWQHHVPGVVVYTSLEQHSKTKLAIVYRILDD